MAGLVRPSTSGLMDWQVVDARDKPGHDEAPVAPEALMTIQIYLTYLLACIAITIIPADGYVDHREQLSHGTRAGLLNVAGTQLGLALMLGVLLVACRRSSPRWAGGSTGCASRAPSTSSGSAGIAALVGALASSTRRRSARRLFPAGFLVLMSNPKALLWFGAFIPQFVDPSGNYVGQSSCAG